jgi:hypothetical protein
MMTGESREVALHAAEIVDQYSEVLRAYADGLRMYADGGETPESFAGATVEVQAGLARLTDFVNVLPTRL